jgi:hypothetical protein
VLCFHLSGSRDRGWRIYFIAMIRVIRPEYVQGAVLCLCLKESEEGGNFCKLGFGFLAADKIEFTHRLNGGAANLDLRQT